MKEQHSIDEHFRKGLEGHKIKPSASVWDKIEAATESKSSNSRSGWYMMSAAMVTVLIGISTWVFYQNQNFSNSGENVIPIQHNTIVDTEPKNAENQKGSKKEEGASDSKDSKNKSDTKIDKQNKVVPIMKQPVKNQIYVSHENPLPEIADEEMLLEDLQSWEPQQVALKVEEPKSQVTPIKVKVKLKPVTAPAFYANKNINDEEKAGFREKMYAYANTQFDNLLSGKPLELPKTEKKPQLEINLGRIFNN